MAVKLSRGRNLLYKWLEWGEHQLAFLDRREARRECELILEDLLGVSRAELYLKDELELSVFLRFSKGIQARKKRHPLAYILGKAFFWESEFAVKKGVFIPRPETESLIDAFLNSGRVSEKSEFLFIDIGTGCGNIAITLAKLFPRARAVASDLSHLSLKMAEENARRLGVEGRIEFIQADALESFEKSVFDVIISNPPYVESGNLVCLEPEILSEPKMALEGGDKGLDFYKKILEGLSCLKAKGDLWLEIGWNQAEAVNSIFKDVFSETKIFMDLEGKERIFAGKGFIPDLLPSSLREGQGMMWKGGAALSG